MAGRQPTPKEWRAVMTSLQLSGSSAAGGVRTRVTPPTSATSPPTVPQSAALSASHVRPKRGAEGRRFSGRCSVSVNAAHVGWHARRAAAELIPVCTGEAASTSCQPRDLRVLCHAPGAERAALTRIT